MGGAWEGESPVAGRAREGQAEQCLGSDGLKSGPQSCNIGCDGLSFSVCLHKEGLGKMAPGGFSEPHPAPTPPPKG